MTAAGLVLALLGAVVLWLTTRGPTRDPGGGTQGDVTRLGFRFRLRGWERAEPFVDRWGPPVGWGLMVLGFALQLVGELRGP